MDALQILGDIVEIIVGGISQVAAGIGEGISTLVQDLFFTTGEGGSSTLSTFAVVLCIFAAVSLALSLCYLIFNWLRSFGG